MLGFGDPERKVIAVMQAWDITPCWLVNIYYPARRTLSEDLNLQQHLFESFKYNKRTPLPEVYLQPHPYWRKCYKSYTKFIRIEQGFAAILLRDLNTSVLWQRLGHLVNDERAMITIYGTRASQKYCHDTDSSRRHLLLSHEHQKEINLAALYTK